LLYLNKNSTFGRRSTAETTLQKTASNIHIIYICQQAKNFFLFFFYETANVGHYGYQNYLDATSYISTADNPLKVGGAEATALAIIDEAWKPDHTGWLPIGNPDTPFTGTFNGAGHQITGLWINRTGDYLGLFGFIDGAIIKNVGLILKAELGQTHYIFCEMHLIFTLFRTTEPP